MVVHESKTGRGVYAGGGCMKIQDPSHENTVRVTDGYLHVCLCDKTCEGCISMDALMERYPGLHIVVEGKAGKE